MTPKEEAKAQEERALRNARAITGSTFGYTELETRLAHALLAMRNQRDEARRKALEEAASLVERMNPIEAHAIRALIDREKTGGAR